MSIAVQTAVGEIGSKALSQLSWNFNGLINCGQFQYGVGSDGIFLLNSGDTYDEVEFESSFTLTTSDYGLANNKRFRYVYLKIEVFEDTDITLSVRPNKGNWLNHTESIIGAGLKTVRFTIERNNGNGNYHTIKVACNKQFRIHEISGLLIVRPLGIKG